MIEEPNLVGMMGVALAFLGGILVVASCFVVVDDNNRSFIHQMRLIGAIMVLIALVIALLTH